MPDVRILPADQTAHLKSGETILAGLCRCGFSILSGCRRGGCGVCKVDLESGSVRYERPIAESVLTPAERAEGIVLACRAIPQDDVVIRLRQGSLRICTPLLRFTNVSPPGSGDRAPAGKEI